MTPHLVHPAARADPPDVSVVVPMRNEEPNVAELWYQLCEALNTWDRSCEFIFVDDGSHDATVATLRQSVGDDPRVFIICLARRFGQTAALGAGFRAARGQVVVPLDADLQNDPADIPMLVAALDDGPGWDVVSGWRKERHDNLVLRRFPSIIANKLISRLTWVRIHDFGCTLKAYRSDIIDGLVLYGEMHRFLPALCQWRGGRITERVVNHRPRVHGKSKYGLVRTIKVMLDLFTVKFLGDYLTKPLYFFAKVGFGLFMLSMLTGAIALLQKFGIFYDAEPGGLNLNRNILAYTSMTLFSITMMILVMGVISELLVRIYHESQGMEPFRIRTTHSPGAESAAAEQPE